MMRSIPELIEDMEKAQLKADGKIHPFKKSNPIREEEIRSKEKELGWPFPADFKEFLSLCGAANIFGVQLLDLKSLRGRGEYDHDDQGDPVLTHTRCFVVFAKSENEKISGNFAFGFTLNLKASMKDIWAVANGQERPAFLGQPYRVFQTEGSGYLRDTARVYAIDFSDFLEKLRSQLE
jgi:hypothetical protein